MKRLKFSGYIYSAHTIFGHELDYGIQYEEINLLFGDGTFMQDQDKLILITNELGYDFWEGYFDNEWICLLNYDAWHDHEGNPMIMYVIARGRGVLHKINYMNNCYDSPTKFNSIIGKLIRKTFLSMKLIKLIR